MAKVNIGLIELPDEIKPIYSKLVSILKKEREIKPTEYGLITTLAAQYYIHQQALNSIINEGAVITSVTQYGEVSKENPQVRIYNNTQIQIQKLSAMLVMTQKEIKALMNAEDDEDDEDDPLAQLTKRRAENKEKRSKE